MKTARTRLTALILLVYGALIAIACTLSSEPAPTIVPRATNTPPPTIGYATLSVTELPPGIPTSAPRIDARLISLLSQVEPDRLILHVNALANMYTRHVLSVQNNPTMGIGAAYNYVRSQFELIRDQSRGNLVLGADHEFPFEWAGVQSVGRNIVAVIPGTETGAGILVIGSHYDSISLAWEDGNAFAPGANDNASGIAALLEIARVMSQRQHRATVMFVAFSAEEIQRAGSIAFAEYLLQQNFDVNWMLNMDIIGSSTGADGSINEREIRVFSADPNDGPGSESRQLARAVQLIINRHVPDMTAILVPSGDREGRYGDQLSFSDRGFAAVRFIEANEEPSRTNNDRDTTDDVQALYLTRSTQTILAAATALADGIRPPQNIVLRDDGNGMRTLRWEERPEAAGYLIALRPVGATSYVDTFVIADPFVQWDQFIPSRYAGVAISAIDEDGLLGPFSFEYQILN